MSEMVFAWFVVPVLFFAGARGEEHRCHVCVSGTGSDVEVERVFPGSPLIPCHRSSEARVCPDNYKGCLTQSKGNQVMRTCAQLAVDACRWANGVEYCYCTGPLCNAPPPPVLPPVTDDEDLTDSEGSGMEMEPPHSQTPTSSTTSTTILAAPTQTSRGTRFATAMSVGVTVSVFVAVWR